MKKIIEKEKKNIIIGLVSLIVLIIGTIYFKFLPVFVLIVIVDGLILYFTKTKKTPLKEKIKSLLIVVFCCFILCLIMGTVFGLYIAFSAPTFTEDRLYNKEASILYTKDGEEYAKLGTESRKKITYDKLSESLIDAIIATEDARFFQHNGIDLPRFLNASLKQLLGRGGGGASTLTMQVSKNSFTDSTSSGIKGIIRKFTDIYMAVFQIEPKFTKEEIIEFYINSNLMGGQIYGVEQASLTYFNKPASELNLAESAMIAGLFQAPNSYNPYKHPEECEKRRITVLSLMLRHGYINQKEFDIAKELTVNKLLVTTTAPTTNKYQAFIDTVVEEVIARTGDDPGSVPMKIYTTIDTKMQENIDNIMSGNTYKWKNDVVQAASAVIDVNTGAIAAIGAGHNRKAGDWNHATMNKRHIGSTAKPLYDFGPGIEYNNWSTYKPFGDEPYSYSDGKSIKNWDGSFFGYITLHDALKYSRNITALKAFQQNDKKKIIEFVKNLGLSPEVIGNTIYETHSIGGYNGDSPLTVAAAYAAFSNGGFYNEPHSFNKIIYLENNKEVNVVPKRKKVMSEETAYMITTILEDTSSYAVGMNVNGVNYCAKTGTTDLPSETIKKYGLSSGAIGDKWIASYNDSYAISLWYGYREWDKTYHLTGADGSFKTLFQAIAKGVYTKKSSWKMPNGVVKVEIEKGLAETLLPSDYTPESFKTSAYFKKGFEPTEKSSRFDQLENVTNLNYNDSTGKISWTKIKTPQYFDTNYLSNVASKLFTNDDYKNKYVNNLITDNNKYIGSVVYKVYVKDNKGTLNLIGTTSDDNYAYKVKGNETIVVKTSYSILSNNLSSGTEINVSGTATSTIITTKLNNVPTDYIIRLNINDPYTEPTKPVTVLENGINDITSDDSTKIKVLVKAFDNDDSSKYQIYDSTIYINTISPKTYEVTYTITVGSFTDTLTKTIIVK